MDHVLWTGERRRGLMELQCVASGPGRVSAKDTEKLLRRAILQSWANYSWQGTAIRQLEVTPRHEEAFAEARAALADRVREGVFCHEIHCATPGPRPRRGTPAKGGQE